MASLVRSVKMPAPFAVTFKLTGTDKTVYSISLVSIWKAYDVIVSKVKNTSCF
jgi:hypothetical protein